MRAGSSERRGLVLAIAGAAVLLRLPFLFAPTGADEGGYLVVARQWHAGTSLYGNYYVDRPPLLMMVFQLAAALGSVVALRVIAAVLVGVAILGVAYAARQLTGPRGAVIAAALAGAWYGTPLLDTLQVNGELLAAPFVAWGIALAIRAISDPDDVLAAAGVGVLAVSALLIKQNMAEPVLFAAVAGAIACLRQRLEVKALLRLGAVAAVGGLALLCAVGGWTALHGTSLTGVFDATYPFRVRAAHQLATRPDAGQAGRAGDMAMTVVTSGVLFVVAAFVARLPWRRGLPPAIWGLVATLGWVTVSIVAGGGFWGHYLVEAVVPVALAGAVAVATEEFSLGWVRRLPLVATAWVLVAAGLHWGASFGGTTSARGSHIGTAISRVAQPGDTMVSAFGDAETVEASGLDSPYPYLWTLPAQVLDPHLDQLTALLRGPDAPTWFMTWHRPAFPPAVLARLDTVVAGHYRPAGSVCGYTVYLHDQVVRAAPRPALKCSDRLVPTL